MFRILFVLSLCYTYKQIDNTVGHVLIKKKLSLNKPIYCII